MKINQIGIDTYRQMTNRPQSETRMAAENKKQAQQAETIQIPGQGEKVGSELSVQLKPGTFVDMLSAEEKQAMEIFFDKYQGVAPRQGAYSNDGQTNSSYLGKQIDVKL